MGAYWTRGNSVLSKMMQWMERDKFTAAQHAAEEITEKPVESKRAYKRRHKRKPRFTLKGNIATLHRSKMQYRITNRGWQRITPKTSKKRIALQERRAA